MSESFLRAAAARANLTTWEPLAEAIAAEFVENQFARLEEAGTTGPERIRLTQVFVDLSVTRSLERGPTPSEVGFLFLESVASDLSRLDDDWFIHGPPDESPEPCIAGRVLLFGGPGQGKSTLVQHLVQGHRRRCLEGLDLGGRVEGFSDAMRSDDGERRAEHVPSRPRLPVVIELARFAAWCTKHPETPASTRLVEYLARECWREAIGVDSVTALLRAAPWLLVLDGVDEVPAQHDRALALECVEPFIETHSTRAHRPLVIATTRPRGWYEEVEGYLPLYLRELSLDESIEYARRVIFARYPTQPRRRERIEERLRAASEEPSVAQLLRTPLLSAIMAHLIAEEGQAPRLRWEVFQRFYETIYNREVARGTTLSPVLAAMRPIVNELHRHAGLVLHAIDERQGGSDAAVSRDWLRMAARRLMEVDDESSQGELDRVDELIEAVEQRLVLLVEREAGRFSYELRSFQEFMAAWALTTGTDANVEARFQRIAVLDAWRNVLLLAMGRLFFERSPLRERLSLGLCEWVRRMLPEGAEGESIATDLALDISTDGLADHAPKLLARLHEMLPNVFTLTFRQAGHSDLSSPAVWLALGLPEPTPEMPSPDDLELLLAAASARALSLDVVALDEIHVANLRCLADVHVTTTDHSDDRGQWIVFLGENGAGKSTLLRAIALALTDRGNASAALKDARAFYVRHGATNGTCAVHLRGRRSLLTIRRQDEKESADPNGYHGEFPWVVAYGCRRGNALGDRDPKRAQTPYADVATLFDDDRGLIDVASWITLQEAASAHDEGARRAYEGVTRCLGQAIGHQFLPARKDGLWVRPASGGPEVQFSSLSDGFLTMAGWIGDLLIRHVSRHHEPRELPEGFAKDMTGVVLIDEIDQNLHPRWQARVIHEVRRTFPRMTFVVTTHNPLTLAGARKSEVFLLSRREGGGIAVEPAQFDPRLRTGTELYSKFFGVDGVFPNPLGSELHRYGTLAGNPYRTEEEDTELERIREHLAREGVTPDFRPVARENDA